MPPPKSFILAVAIAMAAPMTIYKHYKQSSIKFKIAFLSLALFAIAPISRAQETDAPFSLAVGASNCGFATTTPVYCYGVPTSYGSFWLDTYLTTTYVGAVPTYSVSHGFVAWFGTANLSMATVKGGSVTTGTFTSLGRTANLPASITVGFAGSTDDGDTGTYSGTMTLNFSYYYSSGGGGRGGGGAGWRQAVTGGNVNVNYQ
jgi:hypothetical protein